jgi:hypothetical protein
MGCHLFKCPDCDTVKVVPHSCKSVFCSSCGKVRTDAWCKELLSDLLEVKYRHLVFTLPWEIRLPIQDNRKILLPVIFRAAARAILSLTSGLPIPKSREGKKYIKSRKRKYVPGVMVVLHTFGSDLKWNVHVHVVVTCGGLSLDGKKWISSPSRYLVPAPLLGMEWKLNVIQEIARLHQKEGLFCRPLRSDPDRQVDIPKLLGHIRKKRWHILIGPSLQDAKRAVKYAFRYTKRPVISEGRILKYKKGYVTFRFKDYHRGGAFGVKKFPVLTFIDRLVQHLPERYFNQVRHYGLFSSRRKTSALAKARQILAQRKKRRPKPQTWEQRRKAAGDRKPLSCPRCGQRMEYWFFLFGSAYRIGRIIGVEPEQKIPPNTVIHMRDIPLHYLTG